MSNTATKTAAATGIAIRYALLHDFLFIPGKSGQAGEGQYGPTLTSTADATQKAVTMSFDGSLLTVTTKKGTNVLVPVSMIKQMIPA